MKPWPRMMSVQPQTWRSCSLQSLVRTICSIASGQYQGCAVNWDGRLQLLGTARPSVIQTRRREWPGSTSAQTMKNVSLLSSVSMKYSAVRMPQEKVLSEKECATEAKVQTHKDSCVGWDFQKGCHTTRDIRRYHDCNELWWHLFCLTRPLFWGRYVLMATGCTRIMTPSTPADIFKPGAPSGHWLLFVTCACCSCNAYWFTSLAVICLNGLCACLENYTGWVQTLQLSTMFV